MEDFSGQEPDPLFEVGRPALSRGGLVALKGSAVGCGLRPSGCRLPTRPSPAA